MSIGDYIKTVMPYWPNWINFILLKLNIFGPLVYGRSYFKIQKHIDDIPVEEKLVNLVNYAIEKVPYYKKKYGNTRIKSIEDFETKIGFIDKDEVMAHWSDFVSEDINFNNCVEITTGGTSGKPLRLLVPKNRYIQTFVFLHKELKWFGWKYDTRGVIRNHHLDGNRDYIINPILKEIIFDAFRMSSKYAIVIHSILKRYNIHFLHAYPSAAFQFLKYCKNQNLDVSFIKCCMLASEGVTDEQKQFIEEELKIKIYSFYGHSEKLIMAGNCPSSSYYHVEENYGYCELIDDNGKVINTSNKSGELVGTTLYNRDFPLIRYKTGDYSKYAIDQICTEHGDNFKLLDGVEGRWRKQLIFRKDGSTTTTTAMNLHGDFYNHIDGIQYIQEEIGKLTILLIKNDKYTNNDDLFIKSHAAIAMNDENATTISYVERLIYQPNGKFLPLISKLY
ncbi:phenylacetate--CoA ligase family protein [Segatella bryantii]|uniref:phenylacetate--CoA ligase family protein n=1 Tax=Segatella bryantii TaxID=77095 RepID=UPI0024201742|nr:phenylacetate--CoA ligase family protein [Segatella bryantii]